jgi:hypothetical protein
LSAVLAFTTRHMPLGRVLAADNEQVGVLSLDRMPSSSVNAVSLCLSSRREIAKQLPDFVSRQTFASTGSVVRACRRVATLTSIRSITT